MKRFLATIGGGLLAVGAFILWLWIKISSAKEQAVEAAIDDLVDDANQKDLENAKQIIDRVSDDRTDPERVHHLPDNAGYRD